jgi:hypothetical protein
MVLALVGLQFRPWMLAVAVALAWVVAWPRIHRQWSQSPGSRDWRWPGGMIATSACLWFLVLRPWGLYLPNRDFKNHAFLVAQFALDRMAHPVNTFAAGPLSAPEVSGFGRVGLHTLLAWAMPASDGNALGVTAAGAVLPAVVSLPLGLIALARIWRPGSTLLWKLAGGCGVVFPSFAGPFDIGSVVLMFGAAVFPAALAVLWSLMIAPDWGRLALVLLVGAGLAFMHIPEAAGFGLLLVLAAPWIVARSNAHRGRTAMVALTLGGIALVVVPAAIMFTTFPYLSEQRADIQPNNSQLWVALMYPLLAHPRGPSAFALVALGLVLLGAWMTLRERLRPEPLVLVVTFAVISSGAMWSGAPEWTRALAAPWYGAAGRSSLLIGAAIVLLACLPVSAAGEALAAAGGSAARNAGMVLTIGLVALTAVGLGRHQVEQRQSALAETLAGAGDTPALAEELMRLLKPGETVLNLESDGTANLFTAARVPVVVGESVMVTLPNGDPAGDLLTDYWLDLDDPRAARALAQLGVRYLALGTRNIYWGPSIGYAEADLVAMAQLTPVLRGTDITVFRYDPSEAPR